MRHGDALMRAPKDSLRPLSRLGHDQAVQSATYLGSCLQDHKPLGLVLASPYLRAQETTNNVVEQLDYTGELITCNSITPDNSPDTVIKMLSQYESRGPVLMVSHQPLVSGLIGLLTTGNSYEGVSMGTASIACLEMPLVGVGLAELLWLKHSTL
ncbi:MAG: phosphohistidine phosphatase SixA [Moraxellaceae bacterium]|nr:MAG: phosphohistidine phosphatase SixA [Moraxellaceae bacterium]